MRRTPPREAGRFVEGHSYSPTTQIRPGERRSPSTEFKAGTPPHNKKPVGSISIRIDREGNSRAWVKVADPSKWRQRAILVWESENGRKLPRGSVVHHLDRDTLNDNPGNLVALTRKEHAAEHLEEARSSGFGSDESRERATAARRRAGTR